MQAFKHHLRHFDALKRLENDGEPIGANFTLIDFEIPMSIMVVHVSIFHKTRDLTVTKQLL